MIILCTPDNLKLYTPGNVLTLCTSGNVILIEFRFYGPVNPLGACRARSVYLTIVFLGRLSPLGD